MGKRITSQARGRGGPAFKVRKRAYRYKLSYLPLDISGTASVLKIINSSAHSAPILKIMIDKKIFFIPASQGIYEGQEIEISGEKMENGNIDSLKNIPLGTRIFNIEKNPGDGGKMKRSSGVFSTVLKKDAGKVVIGITNKKEITLHENCRATIGVVAGQGRKTKPVVKAGKMHHMMEAKGRKWHRTSAVKVNAIDHPFGGGRGKRIKSKIAKRNSPPGRKVGHIRPSRTGKK